MRVRFGLLNLIFLAFAASSSVGLFVFWSDLIEYKTIAQMPGSILEVCSSSDKKKILFGDSIGETFLIDAEKEAVIQKWKFHNSSVTALAFSSDQSKIAIAYIDGKLVILTLETGKVVSLITTDRRANGPIQLGFNETTLMTHLSSGDLLTVNVANGEIVETQHAGPASGMPFPIMISTSVVGRLSAAGHSIDTAGESEGEYFVLNAVHQGESKFLIGTNEGAILKVTVTTYVFNKIMLALVLLGSIVGLLRTRMMK